MMWVDKYKPSTVKQIIGQQGAQSNMNKLMSWLQNWHSNHGSTANPGKCFNGQAHVTYSSRVAVVEVIFMNLK